MFEPRNVILECQRCGARITTSEDEETGYRIISCPVCQNRLLKVVDAETKDIKLWAEREKRDKNDTD